MHRQCCHKTILVADKREGVCSMMRFMLAPFGAQIVTATDADQIVALAEQHTKAAARRVQSLLETALREGWDIETVLERFVRDALDQHTAAPRLHHVLAYEVPRPQSVVAALHELEEAIAQAIERLLIDRAGIQLRHAKHASYFLVHVVYALVHEFVLHPPPDLNEETFMGEVVSLLEAYLLQPCAAD